LGASKDKQNGETHMKMKIYILAILGIILTVLGAYRSATAGTTEFFYLGISTLVAIAIYHTAISRFKEITSFLLALIVLHSGVILLFVDKLNHPKILGSIVFASGVVFVMASNFSEYLKNRKK
jgi:hypothetical protein